MGKNRDIVDNKLLGSNGFYLRHTFEYFLEQQERLGVKNIELWAAPPHFWIDHYGFEDVKSIGKRMEQHGVKAEILSVPSGPYSLCAPGGSVQQTYTYDYYRNCIRAAGSLGIPYVSVRATGGHLDREAADLYGDCCRSLTELCRCGEDCGVTLLLQTVTRQEANMMTDLYQLRKVFGQIPQIKILLDTVSMSQAGETFSEWFEAFGSEIRHVRFMDGRNDGFRIWGEGCYPMERYMSELLGTGYKGSIGLGTASERCWQDAGAADQKNRSRFLAALEGWKQKELEAEASERRWDCKEIETAGERGCEEGGRNGTD